MIAETAHADKALAKIKAEEQAWKASGEERTNVADLMRTVLQKKAEKKEPPPVMMTCPHCSHDLPISQNIRFWSAEELRNHADVLEECERIAAKNREVA